MNIDRSAFDLRRELGITVTEPAVVARLKEVFESDWELSHHYEAPDPLDPSTHHEDDFPHDPELAHE
jgi:cardiolipin synthase A/B